MNKQECDILLSIAQKACSTQRNLAEYSGHSLGIVNRSVKGLTDDGYIDKQNRITKKAVRFLQERSPKNAIILAAGFGMRMVPINSEVPKGLLEVKGEILVERIIRQLHEAGIQKIYIVVGFMKEKYEYLIDRYGVELLVNSEYVTKNNLHSLKRAMQYISNTYIIPCDIWCRNNPFSSFELYSWYMVSENVKIESSVRVNRKMEIVLTDENCSGNEEIGIAYISADFSEDIKEKILEFCSNRIYDNAFWEIILWTGRKMSVWAKIVKASEAVEIDTYEQLRELDSNSNHLKTEAILAAADALHTTVEEIKNITILKKGMTNRSFLFSCKGKKYIMRIPGEGTDRLINRMQEAEVYRAIAGKGICDDPIYINSKNGYKITEYLDDIRVCDAFDIRDLEECMSKLRSFHSLKLTVGHEFNIFGQIDFYESLWEGKTSVYKDYEQTKANVLSLKSYIDEHAEEKILTHIDAVPDNFLFYDRGNGKELQLTDWEYAGMQDPHVDIAMFCIYALYNRQEVDRLISIYFEGNCRNEVRIKIYCYISVCGLLWSNWCEYKRSLGVEFGEYSLRQYRFAKDYYAIVQEELKNSKWVADINKRERENV